VHSVNVAMAAIHECDFELLSPPTYFLDMALPEYPVYRHLRNSLPGTVFRSDNDLIFPEKQWCEGWDGKFVLTGLKLIQHHWEKAFQLRRVHIKKL
jgi:hypothetical protein